MMSASVVQLPVWTEARIQDALYLHCSMKSHELIVPNSCLFTWEADMISVTRAGFIHEFEIKISRRDFKADARKDKATWLLDPVVRFEWLEGMRERPLKRPNYFHYVVPEGMVEPEEVPEYAGMLYIRAPRGDLKFSRIEEIKQPRRLHSEKIEDKQYRQLERSLVERYWKQRMRAYR